MYWQVIDRYGDLVAGILTAVMMIGLTMIIVSGQNLITPRQHKRIRKLKLDYTRRPTELKAKRLKSPKEMIMQFITEAGFEEQTAQVLDLVKVFALISFVMGSTFSMLLGFAPINSIIFGGFSMVLSPVIPVAALKYMKSSRYAQIADELFIVMTHITDAVEAAGHTLQSAVEESLQAAPVLAPYLRRFLNTYHMQGLSDAVEQLRQSIFIEEMELFLDLLSHGFQHTTQELTFYFKSESDAYHELEVAAKQRRMERREILFDIIIVFPFAIGFGLMIYPVFMQGVDAISHAL